MVDYAMQEKIEAGLERLRHLRDREQVHANRDIGYIQGIDLGIEIMEGLVES